MDLNEFKRFWKSLALPFFNNAYHIMRVYLRFHLKFSGKRSPPAGKRRAMDDMDLDDVQPTYYSGAQKYQGIEVDQHYRIIDDVEAIIKALDDIMPNE